MEIYHVLVLSIIEGVTEFLPISSTAHLILSSHILGLPKDRFLTTFEISIQLGAIASVVFLYFKKIIKDKGLLLKALTAFIPTGVLGFLVYDYIKKLLNDPFIPVATLFLGGLAIIVIEKYLKKNSKTSKSNKSLQTMSYKDALLIGLMQSLSMIPGVSRAAASIFGAIFLKFKRKDAVEFSFLLAIPTMVLATGYDLYSESSRLTEKELLFILLGIVLSFISALGVIKWLLLYIQKNDFTLFGYYRIALSIMYYLLFLR